ncbi:MAG TPA: hypothetical protein VLB80_05145 [Candidatus Babeliales bacterium]|nr:hypothetical protein [Candidatus Babeliales bacterium]
MRYLFTGYLFLLLFSLNANQDHLPNYTIAPTYNGPTYNPTISPHIEVHPNITLTNTSAFIINVRDNSIYYYNKFVETMTAENYSTLTNLIKEYMWHYRYKILGSTLLGLYSIVSMLLLTNYYYTLEGNTIWGHWKSEYDFEHLCEIAHKTLTQDLLCEINGRYYNKNNPTDFAYPLITFLTAIDTEINICKRYIKTAHIIRYIRLMKIFPINEAKIEEVNKVLHRAIFVKHLFLAWLAEYNISSNQKATV